MARSTSANSTHEITRNTPVSPSPDRTRTSIRLAPLAPGPWRASVPRETRTSVQLAASCRGMPDHCQSLSSNGLPFWSKPPGAPCTPQPFQYSRSPPCARLSRPLHRRLHQNAQRKPQSLQMGQVRRRDSRLRQTLLPKSNETNFRFA